MPVQRQLWVRGGGLVWWLSRICCTSCSTEKPELLFPLLQVHLMPWTAGRKEETEMSAGPTDHQPRQPPAPPTALSVHWTTWLTKGEQPIDWPRLEFFYFPHGFCYLLLLSSPTMLKCWIFGIMPLILMPPFLVTVCVSVCCHSGLPSLSTDGDSKLNPCTFHSYPKPMTLFWQGKCLGRNITKLLLLQKKESVSPTKLHSLPQSHLTSSS